MEVDSSFVEEADLVPDLGKNLDRVHLDLIVD